MPHANQRYPSAAAQPALDYAIHAATARGIIQQSWAVTSKRRGGGITYGASNKDNQLPYTIYYYSNLTAQPAQDYTVYPTIVYVTIQQQWTIGSNRHGGNLAKATSSKDNKMPYANQRYPSIRPLLALHYTIVSAIVGRTVQQLWAIAFKRHGSGLT